MVVGILLFLEVILQRGGHRKFKRPSISQSYVDSWVKRNAMLGRLYSGQDLGIANPRIIVQTPNLTNSEWAQQPAPVLEGGDRRASWHGESFYLQPGNLVEKF